MTAPATATTVLRPTGGLRMLTWPALDRFPLDAMVTTRWGGVSSGPYATLNLSLTVGDDPAAVLENRRRVAGGIGADPGDFVFATQVHGADARIVSAADRGRGARTVDDAVPGVDSLVTADPDVVLAVFAADCAPILLYDPVLHVVACVHAGWRGTMARAAAAAVAAMGSLGTRPADVIAGIGPVAAPDGYQVGADVYQAAEGCFGDRAGQVIRPDDRSRDAGGAVRGSAHPRPAGPPRWLLDLWTANRLVLRDAGVPDDQIHVTDLPTGDLRRLPARPATLPPAADAPDGGYFFSDRAQRPCGRFALVARLRAVDARPAGGGATVKERKTG